MVWAMILQPHKVYELQVKNTFRLTMANLDTTSADDKPVQVMFISEETQYLLCTLHKNNVWQVPLNLIIEKGANIAFVCHGGSYVHLLGHLKEYEILKEPEQDCRRFVAELLHDKIEELISYRNRIILNNKEIEYLKVDESVNRNRKRQQLDTSNASIPSTSKDQEDKNQSKRKANPLKDVEIKRMKSPFKSKENYDNEYDKDYEDMTSCNDSDDNNDNDDDTNTDNDNKTIENEDSNETEMEQEEKFMKSQQEKEGKQQRKQDKQTKEEIKREQKDENKKKKQGNNEDSSLVPELFSAEWM